MKSKKVLCPTCRELKSDKLDKEFISMIGECVSCDHCRLDVSYSIRGNYGQYNSNSR